MNCELDYPILSIAPGLNSHEIIIGGGCRSGKNGILNHLSLYKIDSSR